MLGFCLRLLRIGLACLAVGLSRLTAIAAVETESIGFNGGYNFIPINVQVGNNEVSELFPDAPEGMVTFTYDDANGWAASEKTSTTWSIPNLRIPPLHGAVAWLSYGSAYIRNLASDSSSS